MEFSVEFPKVSDRRCFCAHSQLLCIYDQGTLYLIKMNVYYQFYTRKTDMLLQNTENEACELSAKSRLVN